MRIDRLLIVIGVITSVGGGAVLIAAEAEKPVHPKITGAETTIAFNTLNQVHEQQVKEFVATPELGVRRKIGKSNPNLMFKAIIIGDTHYILQSSLLVSLLKNTPPKVYLTDVQPMRDDLGEVKTRDLTAFETKALEELKKGKEIVIDPDAPTMVLGAVRAQESCIECHKDKEKGALLGAFTYTLNEAVKKK